MEVVDLHTPLLDSFFGLFNQYIGRFLRSPPVVKWWKKKCV